MELHTSQRALNLGTHVGGTNMPNIGKILVGMLAIAVGAIGLIVALSALFAVPVYYLWNGLMPKLFGLTSVTFLQAWGLNLLAGFMFGGRISKKS